jgi:hypothetical protein
MNLEAINIDQLVTATDRLLFSGGLPKRRPSAPRLEHAAPVVDERTVLVRDEPTSLPFLATIAMLGAAVGLFVGTAAIAVATL